MFIQPCFIRKNTPELRMKLEELGVSYDGFYGIDNECIVTGYGPYNNTYDTLNHPPISINYHTRKYGYIKFKYIDCKTNEELFLALAALRDDTQINQYYWFNNRLFKCEGLEIDRILKNNTANYLLKCRCVDNPMIVFCFKERNVRKATAEEIIEHFK